MSSRSPVSHISDTARWVAVYRAMESERPDALFQDPYARALAGAQGEEIVRAMPKARQFAWPMVVRTVVIDDLILTAVDRHGADTVLNLAAGLDTRPYRLPLPKQLRWIDADLPDILGYKQEQLASERPTCALEYARVDLTDADQRRALFTRIGNNAERVLVVTEGLLVYLESGHVAELSRDLHAQPSYRWWVIDLASPRLLKMLQRTWGDQLQAGRAPLIFAPEEGTAFFEPHGWKEGGYRSMWEESLRLGRTMRFARLWNWITRLFPRKKREEFRRMSGIVLLERI